MPTEIIIVVTVLALYAAIVVSPGPNFALVSRLAISGARRAAVGATIGMACAATFYAVLSMSGLALLLTRIGWLAGAVQIAGGLFLVYLGVKSWLYRPAPDDADTLAPTQDSFARGLRLGILVNLGNPKGIAFFISLYAATIPPGTSTGAKTAILAGGFALEVLWYGLVVWLLSTEPARRAYRRFGIWIERAMGTFLILFGIRLILEKRT
ncbi:LysE family translocator [Roseicitreum antarcticum]|jgi:threonine/homoserine/homoserine lactone efflux protein|uniref:Threonine/homoserine/homoserine lactone efflux protein n=1 Tax=Roseicitreum antarcticum TaxID=564137 RepID=A0A1H3D9Y0_9RHOB|nr:LysE family transporter [Roseicitreum antarcticum]SDX62554.1 Threonine/homoserine/homoserine lactone efflux protein [Roseicitreum antarcticum]